MVENNGQWKFQGFSSPNGTYVPDEFFDQVAPRLSGSEVKLALYMIRRTYGFKKESDNIALSQMLKGIVRRDGSRLDLGAGLSKATLLQTIKRLEEKNIIHRTHQWDIKGGNLATNYRLTVWETTLGKNPGLLSATTSLNPDPGGGGIKSDQGEVENSPRPQVKKPTTQDTVKQYTVNVNVACKKKGLNPLHGLTDKQTSKEHAALIAEDILLALGDRKSARFYSLVARKVPESYIRRTLSELKVGGAEFPARVFTSKVMEYAAKARKETRATDVSTERHALSERFRNP